MMMQILQNVVQRLEALERAVNGRTDDVLDVDGAMALTGLSRYGIYHKTCSQNGEPPELSHFKRGKRLYFLRSELIAWLTEHRVMNRTEIEQEVDAYTESRDAASRQSLSQPSYPQRPARGRGRRQPERQPERRPERRSRRQPKRHRDD